MPVDHALHKACNTGELERVKELVGDTSMVFGTPSRAEFLRVGRWSRKERNPTSLIPKKN